MFTSLSHPIVGANTCLQAWTKMVLGAALWVIPATVNSKPHPLLPTYDVFCDAMQASRAPLDLSPSGADAYYFMRPIERQIHQVWYGDPAQMDRVKVESWRLCAILFGYSHTLWTEQDLPMLEALMPTENYRALQNMLALADYAAASDLTRAFVLAHFGGIYSDVDIQAPKIDGILVDIAAVAPLYNLVVMSEHFGRNIGHQSALFAANGFMMASARHPVMLHLVSTVVRNLQSIERAAERGMDAPFAEYTGTTPGAAYQTGPFFLNLSLFGPVTVLPITYLEALGMADAPSFPFDG